MRKIIIAVLIALLPTLAAAQMPNLPSGTVWGRTQVGTGPGQAVPFATLIAAMLASSPTIPTINTSTILFAGSVSGTATLKAQAAAGTPTVQLPNTSGTLVDNATLPVVANAVTGNVSCPNCSIAISTRTAAAAQDLSAYSLVRTNGYGVVADGGSATFKNVGTAPFLDSFVATCTMVGGASYTNGTYPNIQANGGTGTGINGIVTVAGGVVTTYNFRFAPGNAYTVGDVLTFPTANIGGTGSGASCTVATLTTPSASFTDSAGTHWQYIPDQGVNPNIKQFGAKVDGATNDFTVIQNALWYAGRQGNGVPVGGPGFLGGKVTIGSGTTVLCPAVATELIVPFGVTLEGASFGSNIDICAAWVMGGNPIVLGNPDTQAAAFKSSLRDVTVTFPRGITVPAGVAMIFSNNTQDGGGLDHVYIYAGQFSCLIFLTGYGGASTIYMNDVSCSSEGSNIQAIFNYGTTAIVMDRMIFGAPTSGTNNTTIAMQLNGGMYDIRGFHTEQTPIGIQVNMSSTITANMASLQTITGGNGCTSLVDLTPSNTAGNTRIVNASNNGCTNSVNDRQTSGSGARTAPITPISGAVIFNP